MSPNIQAILTAMVERIVAGFKPERIILFGSNARGTAGTDSDVDLIVVMQRRFSKEKGMQRRVMQIAEVSRMETKVLLSNIYEFNEAGGILKRTEVPSSIIEDVATKNSITKNDLRKEIDLRQMVLEWMLRKGIRQPLEVLEVMQSYYYNPKKVLSAIQSLEE